MSRWSEGVKKSPCCFENNRLGPLTRLATLATLSPKGGEGCGLVRPRSQPGHIAIIEFVRQRTDKKHASLLTFFDRLRRKRNTALYDDTGFVSQHDAEEAIAIARKYLRVIRGDIDGRRPQTADA